MKFSLKIGALITVWTLALSGWNIRSFPLLLISLHLILGLVGAVVIAAFLRRHWWERRYGLAQHVNTRWGLVALAIIVLLIMSGVALLKWTNLPWLQRLHGGTTVALLGVLTFHITWRLRGRLGWIVQGWQSNRLSHSRPRGSLALRQWLVSGGVAGLLMAPIAGGAFFVTALPSPVDALPIAHASLSGRGLPTASDCAACHSELASQWRTSIHAQAATDPYYQALTIMFVQERGVEALRYCAACHAPVGLMQGEVVSGAGDTSVPIDSASQAYAARALGVHLPVSPGAAEGVTCAICHLATGVYPAQNAGLRIVPGSATLPAAGLPRLALRSAPADHRRSVRHDILEEAALCGACHNLRSPEGLLLEPTYQEWLDSPYSEQGKSCQTCHYPPTAARLANSSPLTANASHGDFPGAPSSLPGVSTGTDLLRQAARLSLQAAKGANPEELALAVTVINAGAGHYLPTGADDLRQVWLEVTLLDSSGEILWQTGGLDEYGELLPGTLQFRKVLGDANGRPIELHRFWVATQVLEDTRLAPLENRQQVFAIHLPAEHSGPLRLTARLLYRDVPVSFAAFALEKPVPNLAVFEMANQELEIVPSQLISVR